MNTYFDTQYFSIFLLRKLLTQKSEPLKDKYVVAMAIGHLESTQGNTK